LITVRPMRSGDILALIRRGDGITRNELMAQTGLGRSTVAQRVDALLARGLVREEAGTISTGGRPPTTVVFDPRAALILAADLGATHSRLAVTDLSGVPLQEQRAEIAIADGPEAVLSWVADSFATMLELAGRTPEDVGAIGVGVPGPVEFASGRPVSPPIMPGWDRFPIPERLQERFPVPVLVDNDVNIMALGEHLKSWPHVSDMLYVKVGTGIGCGIITGRAIYRGWQGAAGDIGHIRLPDHDDVICECGNVGCLEAVAGGRALVRALRALGHEVATSRDVVALVRAHDLETVRLVRQAGRDLGEVLAGLVNALNPEVIVVGGDVAGAHEQLFAGIREVVYERSTALATRNLQIVPSQLDDRAGIIGAAGMATEHLLSPEQLDAWGNGERLTA
jgi:predicted NBD/HSP70 family sugar kinase